MGAKNEKEKSTLKPVARRLYTFHRTETKVTCYVISHKYSSWGFFAHTHSYSLKHIFFVALAEFW